MRKRGFNRLYQNGQLFEFSTPESLLEIDFTQPVFILLDRIVWRTRAPASWMRWRAAIARRARSLLRPRRAKAKLCSLRFSQRFECKRCNLKFEEPEPRLFSFNNPYGACPRCQGFGNTIDFDMDLVIPDKSKTLAEGAIEPWTKPKYRPLFGDLRRFARARNIALDVPWQELPSTTSSSFSKATEVSASAASSTIWSARSTSCTCAFS